MFDGKHSDQTVLNKLPKLITDRRGSEESGMREEMRGRKEGKGVSAGTGGFILNKSDECMCSM